MGLGSFGGGAGVARFLIEAGAQVTITDMRLAEQLHEGLGSLGGLAFKTHLGGHLEDDFTAEQTDMVVVNPAVKKDSPFLQIARQHGVQLTSEMNIFFQMCPAIIVGVTGSNGKSTTSAMITEVLAAGAGGNAQKKYRRVWVGGNIGRENLLSKIEQIEPDDVVVLELSSFQLHDLADIEISPQVAVVTNIGPNHLDWHGDMDA
ncbi:MAG: UDP-N-acetylmuramoyl-L-alanine--D-glutamate ligase, partial [Planctomycetes bacterium]|nr:UDP-N-acetylmuramoyl-L-alanine--D-glutamate ligase [Planctomycetota bacterium]